MNDHASTSGREVPQSRGMKSAPTLKVRSIVLTAPEVRAVLNRSKTQHRIKVAVPRYMRDRIVCFDKAWADPGFGGYGYLKLPNRHRVDRDIPVEEWPVNRIYCPLADDIGSQLWVRETTKRFTGCPVHIGKPWPSDAPWALSPDGDPYKALLHLVGNEEHVAALEYHAACVTVPSAIMPRWASRITLTVESVRAQRVQDITEEDARADGVDEFPICIQDQHGRVKPAVYHRLVESCRDAYQRKHISRYGADSWRANDWVFALTFKPLLPEVIP